MLSFTVLQRLSIDVLEREKRMIFRQQTRATRKKNRIGFVMVQCPFVFSWAPFSLPRRNVLLINRHSGVSKSLMMTR